MNDLSHFGVIKVSGKDAEKFLQGQFTNDVRDVTTKQSQLSACCNHKGRIIVNFRLFLREGAYYMLLPAESLVTTMKRLQMYVLRSAVTLEDMSSSLFHLGIVEECFGDTVPEAWELLDILAGLPQILPATSEKFVPQMLNFQAIGGLSFKKGCYTGQEVVARLKYMGTLKRRMYLAKIETSSLPKPGDDIYVKEESVGNIVNAQAHPDGGVVVLAVIMISRVESEDIFWQDGKYLQFMDLPYQLSVISDQ